MCVALGLGVLLFPLDVRLPRGVLLVFAASPLLTGLALIAPMTPRWAHGMCNEIAECDFSHTMPVQKHNLFIPVNC